MRPVGFKLFIFDGFGGDHLDAEVFILWHVHHLDIVTVDSYMNSEWNI